MARLTCIFLLVIATAAPCLADVGHLGMYADESGSVCELHDAGGLITTYVVHKFFTDGGATGSRFRIEPPDNGTWLFLTFDTPFVPIGSALTDLSVGYGVCINTSTTIGRALWFSTVPVPGCGIVALKPGDPGQIIISDCSFTEQALLLASHVYVNPTPAPGCNCWGATEPATWGKVKALYR